ncbi:MULTISPECIES: hypothetical protein [unclassified Polaribacter]|jgi:hypothetical protein|uniref:hypothetical protein n=1 Tax=unclassified Polaribacter TaxID=196858 RepID=UPI001C4F8323|nr:MULTISPECIES: hypothetical protein [unclassified Polaribacter]QXP63755.1 hypothetical protein H0I27_00705 [Polaribacter sp. HaHaR_3_91]QXP66257.1 hypothetical protein H0I28_13855 [Polaribacter sp. AHE13PA]QXP71747.1 hypothetical protein H0I29_06610 [Polaribacter sp. R2A056_3_33]
MKNFLYIHRKKVPLIGISLILIGALLAYLQWGKEPGETISGVFCGLGFGLTIIGLGGIKKPDKL